MDTKTIAFGIAVVVTSIGGSVVVNENKQIQIIAASEKPADLAIVNIANVEPVNDRKICSKDWVQLGTNPPQLGWLCDKAFLPEIQDELEKLANGGTLIEYSPRDDNGVTFYDAIITTGITPRQEPPSQNIEHEKLDPHYRDLNIPKYGTKDDPEIKARP